MLNIDIKQNKIITPFLLKAFWILFALLFVHPNRFIPIKLT